MTAKPVEAPEPPQFLAHPDLWSGMSPENRDRARKIVAAMAEAFERPQSSFSLFVARDPRTGRLITTAVYTGYGIDLGNPNEEHDPRRSWNKIFPKSDPHHLHVHIDHGGPEGQWIDTRNLTLGVYQTLVDDCRARGVAPPDSEQMAREQHEAPNWTWLTGEIPAKSFAPAIMINAEGEYYIGTFHRTRDDQAALFRPAAVIEAPVVPDTAHH